MRGTARCRWRGRARCVLSLSCACCFPSVWRRGRSPLTAAGVKVCAGRRRHRVCGVRAAAGLPFGARGQGGRRVGGETAAARSRSRHVFDRDISVVFDGSVSIRHLSSAARQLCRGVARNRTRRRRPQGRASQDARHHASHDGGGAARYDRARRRSAARAVAWSSKGVVVVARGGVVARAVERDPTTDARGPEGRKRERERETKEERPELRAEPFGARRVASLGEGSTSSSSRSAGDGGAYYPSRRVAVPPSMGASASRGGGGFIDCAWWVR